MTNTPEIQAESQAESPVDVAVIGGGVAGLTAALTLVRARRSVLVVDAGHPRNAPAAHAHGYLTRDGINPLELVRVGRLEVRGYGGEIIDGEVTSLKRRTEAGQGGFTVALADGTSRDARRLLVATGLVDVLPDIAGLRERWGRDVVHCPFCFGWETRDKPLGVIATGPRAVEQALLWRQWNPDVMLFRHTAFDDTDLTDDQYERLAARDITVVDGEVAAVEVADDRLTGVRLGSGRVIPRRAVVVVGRMVARHELLDDLGVTVAEPPAGLGEHVVTGAMGFAAPGVWVAGNTADLAAGVVQSAASGVNAAAALMSDLVTEDTDLAVAARRG